jgi:hypothetical protein
VSRTLKRVFVLERNGELVHSSIRRERLNTNKDAENEHVATYVDLEEISSALDEAAPNDATRAFLKQFFLEQAWQWLTKAVK